MLPDQVRHVIATVFERPVAELPEHITPQTLEGWNSFRHIRLIVELENEFGVEIDPDVVPELTSADAMVDHLAELLGAVTGAGVS